MSALHVRNMVRQWCEQIGNAEGIPFYDTINRSHRPNDNVWFTVEFFATEVEGMFCKDNYMEVGSVTLVVIARPGIGDVEAVSAMEAILPALYAMTDVRFAWESWEPVFEDTAGSADRDYRIGAILNYRHSSP